jgi:endo-1,4-beta-xylanase
MNTRREFLAGSGAAALLGRASVVSAGSELEEGGSSLRELAKKSGILFGTAVLNSMMQDSAARQHVLNQCSLLTPVGALKWDALRPSPSEFDFGAGDAFIQFAEQNRIVAHGHTLLWYQAIPLWLNSVANKSNANELLAQHITTVVQHYRTKISFWDVVNEVINPKSTRADMLRESPWLRLIGSDYIERAFHLARAADPHATLVWNEDDLESDTDYSRVKRRAVLKLLSELLGRQVPVQGFGLQAHLKPSFSKNNRDYLDFLRALKDTGVKLLISEMDVIDTDIPARSRDEIVASLYYNFISATCKVFKPVSIQVWELSDYRNWMDTSMPEWRRKDGQPHRPAVFDERFVPKPAFIKVQQAFREIQ